MTDYSGIHAPKPTMCGMTTPAIALRQVPEDLAVAMTWAWPDGRLEFRFPHAKDEQACLVRLADWLAADEENATILADWMQRVERAYEAA